MSITVQIRRGNTAQHSAFTGANAELTYNTDQKVVVAHDGINAGGTYLVSNNQLQANIQYFVNTSQISSNLSNYVTTTNLSNNLANYQTTAGLSANIAAYLPIYTGVVNGASHTVGTSTVANATGVYTGIVNATTISTGSVNVINASGLTTTANVNIGAAGELVIAAGAGIFANGGLGSAGEVLHSNGSSIYWATDNEGVTSVATGNGLTGGTITTTGTLSVLANNGITANSTGLFVTPGTGAVVNSTGVHINATYIGTISANNTSFLGGTAAASYQLNSTLAANVAILTANNANNLGGVAAASYVNNSGTYTLSGVITHSGNTVFNNNILISAGANVYANGALGSAGQALTTNGSSVYWSTIVGTNTAALYTWTNNHTYNANVTIAATGELIITAGAGIYANGSLGTANQILTSNGSSIYWATAGGGGATLTANSTDTQTFYIPMANTTTGTWSNAVVSTAKLYFVPSTGTLSATIFNALSDESQKTDINTINNALDIVSGLRGVSFTWKETGKSSTGVIAQEVEKVLPELVTDKDGLKSVNYDGLIGVLIESIKELKEEIRVLKQEKYK